jgi:hypothetical protein
LETVKDSTFVRLPPSDGTFKQHVLRSSYQTKIWLIAHIPKPAVASPLEHGCKDGKFGLEPILFEGQMSSDFCRTSYATEDPFVVKVVFVLNRICLAQNFVPAKH